MNYLRALCFAIVVCFSGVASAQDFLTQKWDDRSAANKFVYGESMVGIVSYASAKNPRALGALQAVLLPFGVLRMSTNPDMKPLEPWLTIAGIGALVVYDFRVDKTRTSEREIFKTNFAWINALGAIELAADYLVGDRTSDRKVSFAYEPAPRGGTLFLTYRF